MTKDPIVEEVRATREKLFDACNGDLDVFLKRLKDQERQDRSRLVSRRNMKAKRAPSGGQRADATDPNSVRTSER